MNYTKIPQNEVEERYECPNCGAPPFIPLHNSVEFESYKPMCHMCGDELKRKDEWDNESLKVFAWAINEALDKKGEKDKVVYTDDKYIAEVVTDTPIRLTCASCGGTFTSDEIPADHSCPVCGKATGVWY